MCECAFVYVCDCVCLCVCVRVSVCECASLCASVFMRFCDYKCFVCECVYVCVNVYVFVSTSARAFVDLIFNSSVTVLKRLKIEFISVFKLPSFPLQNQWKYDFFIF